MKFSNVKRNFYGFNKNSYTLWTIDLHCAWHLDFRANVLGIQIFKSYILSSKSLTTRPTTMKTVKIINCIPKMSSCDEFNKSNKNFRNDVRGDVDNVHDVSYLIMFFYKYIILNIITHSFVSSRGRKIIVVVFRKHTHTHTQTPISFDNEIIKKKKDTHPTVRSLSFRHDNMRVLDHYYFSNRHSAHCPRLCFTVRVVDIVSPYSRSRGVKIARMFRLHKSTRRVHGLNGKTEIARETA